MEVFEACLSLDLVKKVDQGPNMHINFVSFLLRNCLRNGPKQLTKPGLVGGMVSVVHSHHCFRYDLGLHVLVRVRLILDGQQCLAHFVQGLGVLGQHTVYPVLVLDQV